MAREKSKAKPIAKSKAAAKPVAKTARPVAKAKAAPSRAAAAKATVAKSKTVTKVAAKKTATKSVSRTAAASKAKAPAKSATKTATKAVAKTVKPAAKKTAAKTAVPAKKAAAPAKKTAATAKAKSVAPTKAAAVRTPAVKPRAPETPVKPKAVTKAQVKNDKTKVETPAPVKPLKVNKAKAREAERALIARADQKPEDAEARRMRLKSLIKLGKERSFLTYAEINDHLPDVVDAEQIESMISTFNDMGIQVYDEAPDTETLLMSEGQPAAAPDEDAEEEAEAALATVDPEFGRTTDPVRMYMREMGSVELLTREGEIEIAKRIEDGLKHMVQAISACPTTIAEALAHAEKIGAGTM